MNSLPRRSSGPRHRAGHTCGPACGFKLLELVVVVAIIAVMTAMAVPSVLSTLQYRKVENAMSSAGGAIQSTRYLAMSNGIPYSITFSSAASTYQVSQCNNCGAIYDPDLPLTYSASGFPIIPFSSSTAANPGAGAVLGADQTIYFRPGGAVQWSVAGVVQTNCATPLSMTFAYQNISKTLTVGCYGQVTVPQ